MYSQKPGRTMKHVICILLLTLTFLLCQSQALFPFRVDSLWGYKNKQGVVKIEPQFQYASRFFFSIAIAAKDDKFGVIDSNNNLIIPFRYEFLQPLDTSEFLFGFHAKYFGEYLLGVMTKEEKIKIPANYNFISKNKGSYRVSKNVDSIIGRGSIGDVRAGGAKYGLADGSGKVVIPCRYHYVDWINDSLFVVDSSFLTVDKRFLETRCALFNKKGEQLTTFEYNWFGKFAEGLAIGRIGNKCGFIYPNGKVAIPMTFDICEDFNNGFSIIKQQNKWGAIDKKGKIIIVPKYEYEEVKASLKEKYGS